MKFKRQKGNKPLTRTTFPPLSLTAAPPPDECSIDRQAPACVWRRKKQKKLSGIHTVIGRKDIGLAFSLLSVRIASSQTSFCLSKYKNDAKKGAPVQKKRGGESYINNASTHDDGTKQKAAVFAH
jgi:hypothetical protein